MGECNRQCEKTKEERDRLNGVYMSKARAMENYGAMSVVSGHIRGELAASSDPRELGVPNERVLAKPFTRDAYLARVLAVLEGAPVTS